MKSRNLLNSIVLPLHDIRILKLHVNCSKESADHRTPGKNDSSTDTEAPNKPKTAPKPIINLFKIRSALSALVIDNTPDDKRFRVDRKNISEGNMYIMAHQVIAPLRLITNPAFSRTRAIQVTADSKSFVAFNLSDSATFSPNHYKETQI